MFSELRLARVEERTEYAQKLDKYFEQKSDDDKHIHIHTRTAERRFANLSVHSSIHPSIHASMHPSIHPSVLPSDGLPSCVLYVLRACACRDADRKQLLEDVLHSAVEKRKAKLAAQQQ